MTISNLRLFRILQKSTTKFANNGSQTGDGAVLGITLREMR